MNNRISFIGLLLLFFTSCHLKEVKPERVDGDQNTALLANAETLSNIDDFKFLEENLMRAAKVDLEKRVIPVFRYDYTSCSECTDSVLRYIDNSRIRDKVIIITNFDTEEQFSAWKENVKLKNVYWVKKDKFKFGLEHSGNSYFFLYHAKEQRISNPFVPIKILPDRTVNYLGLIASKIGA